MRGSYARQAIQTARSGQENGTSVTSKPPGTSVIWLKGREY